MDMKQVSKYTTQNNTEHNNSRNSQYRNSTNTVSETLCAKFQRIQNCRRLYKLKEYILIVPEHLNIQCNRS
jgi:hypothetical protein